MLVERRRVQRRHECAQAWRHDDEIARRSVGFEVGMRDARRNENGRPRRRLDIALHKAKRERPLQDVPGLIVAVMDMQILRPAPRPLVYVERTALGSDGLRRCGFVLS